MAYQSKRLKKRKKKRVTRKTALLITLALTLVFFFFYLVWHDGTQIKEVSVTGTEYINPSIVEVQVKKEFDQDGFSLVPQSSIIFFQKGAIKNILVDQFPRIESLEIDREGFSRIVIRITEREERYVGCIGESCYYLDKDSLVFAEQRSEDFLDLRTFALDGEKMILGEPYTSRESFDALNLFVDALEDEGFAISQIDLASDEIRIIVSDGAKLVVSEKDNYDEEYTYVFRLLENNVFSLNADGGFVENIDYINLRFGTKIFYCEIGDECEGNF